MLAILTFCLSADGEQTSPSQEKSKENINVRAAMIHVVGDLIQSIGVLVAAIIIYFKVSRYSGYMYRV